MGSEFPDFFDSLDKHTVGLRANTLKISPEPLKALLPYSLNWVPWSSSGFWFDETEINLNLPRPGRHPFHAAGLYYLQDPSAMAVAELLQPKPGELALDICAAPGGKSSHIAGLMADKGVLVANEVHLKRVWELASNLERLGVRKAAVTNETSERLSQILGPIFDRVLVDAPCSGEAMFSESEAARRDWSIDLVHSCSLRQNRILEAAAGLVKPGGTLAYSTCTFNPVENESVIARFLINHAQFRILATDRTPGCSAGRPDWLDKELAFPEIEQTTRIWPHLAAGQGHFIAILRREAGDIQPEKHASATDACPAEIYDLLIRFCSENLGNELPENDISNKESTGPLSRRLRTENYPTWLKKEQLRVLNNQLYWIPPDMPDLNGLRILRPGWWLGSLHAGDHRRQLRFEPSHTLAMGLSATDFTLRTAWSISDPEVSAYLRGHALPFKGDDGWSLVTVDGHALGWGKVSKGILKNHYPRGLRWN